MSGTLAEASLSRILSYIRMLGVTVTDEIALDALRLVQEALQQHDVDCFAFVMDRLPQRFSLPPPEVADPMPPMHRGSIGYGTDR